MKEDHFELLGRRGEDLVTGFKGVVTCLSFDLYGCIQIVLTPPVDEQKAKDGKWFDIGRIKMIENTPVMPVPDYEKGYIAEGNKGAAEKPTR